MLKQEYIWIPRCPDESLYKIYYNITHPSYTFSGRNGAELDIRDVMEMDFRTVKIIPRTKEIGRMQKEYICTYEAYEEGIKHALSMLDLGRDLSHSDMTSISNAIDRYNSVYREIGLKEEAGEGYILRDQRQYLSRIYQAYYLGGLFKKRFCEKGGGINISHIANKAGGHYNNELVPIYIAMIDEFPRILSRKECDIATIPITRIGCREYSKKIDDPAPIFVKSRQKWIKEHQKEYDAHRYIFLDEDRMGLYRMVLETGLSKTEIWERCGFDQLSYPMNSY